MCGEFPWKVSDSGNYPGRVVLGASDVRLVALKERYFRDIGSDIIWLYFGLHIDRVDNKKGIFLVRLIKGTVVCFCGISVFSM